MKKILITDQFPLEGLQELYKYFKITYPDKIKFSREEILELIKDYQIILGGIKADKTFFEKAKKLEFISNYGVGYDSIDLTLANERGIIVTNTPFTVTEATAELAFGLMLSLLRRITELDKKLRTDPNLKWGLMCNLGEVTYGLTIGIFGMGRIGKAIAKRAKVFGMKIIYHNRNKLEEYIEKEFSCEYVSKETLLNQADVVILSLPLTKETFHYIGEKEINLMKKNSYIVNIARGPIIDEKILIKALQENRIKGAALDVFENEPYIPEELLQLENVVLTPHIGTACIRTRIEMAKEASNNIISYFVHHKPINIVNNPKK